ncbi:MAG: succinate--CoA ligase subunit alpha, partial [Bdellovibrionota bacterium]
MSIWINKNTKILVQGITGKHGSFHAEQCMAYGSQIVAGVTPGKGGTKFMDKVPIFNSVREAKEKTGASVSMLFVPPAFAADAIAEGVDADLDLIVAITEGIPVADMMKVKAYMRGKRTRLLGPNCPGI